MLLYTCRGQKRGAPHHPCGRAAQALDDNGHEYRIEVVGGMKLLPWSRRGKRDAIRELTGQDDVPVLVLDDDAVVVGSEAIAAWAGEHPGPGHTSRRDVQ